MVRLLGIVSAKGQQRFESESFDNGSNPLSISQ